MVHLYYKASPLKERLSTISCLIFFLQETQILYYIVSNRTLSKYLGSFAVFTLLLISSDQLQYKYKRTNMPIISANHKKKIVK